MSSTFQNETPGLDPWALLGLPGQVSAASFLTTSNAHQYRLIVSILADQQTRSLTGVSHDDLVTLVRDALPGDELVDALNLDAACHRVLGQPWWTVGEHLGADPCGG